MASPAIRVALCLGAASAQACGPFFYQAPPSLDTYPERQAIRTWREIFPEKFPPPPNGLTREEVAAECAAIVATFAAGADTLRRIDELQAANRTGDYRVRYANFLNEARELARSDIEVEGLREYLRWRLSIIDSDDGFIRRKPAATDFYISDGKREESVSKWSAETGFRLSEIARLEAALPPELAPNLAVQRGAWLFRRGEFVQAAECFDEAISADPGSARAEVALLLQARCAIELSRDHLRESQRAGERYPGPEVWDHRRAALELLRAYEERYPNGRFLPDVVGWQGAVASDSGNLEEAANQYLRQMEVRPTREVIRSALRELDRCYEKAIETGQADSLPIEQIAKNPAAAMCLVYRCLDPGARRNLWEGFAEDYSGGRAILRWIEDRVVRPSRDASGTLVRLGREIANTASTYSPEEWKSFHLAILAWAAIESGEPKQALSLLDRYRDADSPDLLMCRGIALERLGRYREAEIAYLELAKIDANGPLSTDLSHRIAVCRRHIHESGLAVVELTKPIETPEETTPYPSLRLSEETEQWIDTLLQFGPLDELERALAAPDVSPDTARRVRTMIRCRAIARGDFARAEQWLEDDPAPARTHDDDRFSLSDWRRLDRARWDALARPIMDVRARIPKTSTPDDRAAALLELGDLWMQARGRLTSPSLDPEWIFNSQPEIADLQRRKNGIHSGHAREAVNAELDRRDEAWHALQCYLLATNCGATPALTARALAASNECLLSMAQLTPYQAARAFELDHSKLSRQLHRRLLREFPDAAETSSTVQYTFDVPMKIWMPGDTTPWIATMDVAKAISDYQEDSWETRAAIKPLREKLSEISSLAGGMPLDELRSELSALRSEFLPHYDRPSMSDLMNDLDDLALFLDQPGVTPADCARYFPARLTGRAERSAASPAAPDFLEFIRCIDAARDRSPAQTETIWNDFLSKFPDGPKSEAAALRALRARYRAARTHVRVEPSFWPQAPIWNGYKRVSVTRDTPADPAGMLAAIDAYDHRYPHGRYAAESIWMRGGTLVDAGEYEHALACLTSILDDPSKRDLHLDASLDLADCFTRLWDAVQRPALIDALRKQPRAIGRLRRFIESETCGAQLQPMQEFLREQVGEAAWDAALETVTPEADKRQAHRTTPASHLLDALR